MAPKALRKRDRACLLLGGRVPMLLREFEEGRYGLIGDVYVHGIMGGESLNRENYQNLKDYEIL